MELFVVNRHGAETKETPKADEEAKMARLMKRIEKNKQTRVRQKEREQENKAFVNEVREKRFRKKMLRASRVPLPSGPDEFIDENITKSVAVQPDANTDEAPKKKPKLDPTQIEGFTVLGKDTFDKKTKVKRVLPKWLSNPTVISTNLQDLQTKVSSMKVLDRDLRKKLKANGVTHFFPVQTEVVPWLLQANKQSNLIFPRDVCVSAPTGSGKTLAFVLPVVQALKAFTFKRIRALVILPTQELAQQVFNAFSKYTQGTDINVCSIIGKSPFAMEQKKLVVKNEAFGFLSKTDILVCTAGRLVDHLKGTEGLDLRHLKFLIIDEADRVLENVQNDWLYHLEKHVHEDGESSKVLNLFTLKKKRPPQKLLFSATLSQDPEKLQKLSLFQPKLFTSVVEGADTEVNTDTFIGKYTTPKELTEKYIECTIDLKPLVLYKFVKQESLTKTMIFTDSVESAHRLAILLQALFKSELRIEEISSQLEPTRRNTLVDDFAKGKIDVVVCTDRLARGMDLIGVQCVISYSAPKYIKNYIHRVGRTARAGEPGLAVTLVDKKELSRFLNSLKLAGKSSLEEIKIAEEGLEALNEQYKEAVDNLKETVTKEEEEQLTKLKATKRRYKKRKSKSKQNVDT